MRAARFSFPREGEPVFRDWSHKFPYKLRLKPLKTVLTDRHILLIIEKRNAHRILVGKPEGKRPLGRPRCRSVDNIKMDFREIGCGGMDWIDLAQNRDQWRPLMNTVIE
jgi:hypothetical protein